MQKKTILCCSYPKSGRSWLRFILANYINEIYSLNLSINFNNIFTLLPNNGPNPIRGIPAYKYKYNTSVPFILFDHSLYNPQYAKIPIIFIIRDANDTLVSNFFQDKYRIKCFDGNIQEYIRSENGIKRYIQYLNSWSTDLIKSPHVVISYELMHKSIHECTSNIIKNILNLDVNEDALKKSIELSDFNNMKKIEIESGFPNAMLNNDASDNNSLRAREGKIGNYSKHLDKEDIEYISVQLKNHMSSSSLALLDKYCS